MFERFTERARQVIVLAQEEARVLQHGYIGTEHLLLGLLREEEGVGARVLEALDVTTERARANVVRICGSGPEVVTGQIPFTPRAQKVCELALREALSLGHNYIGTEHILLGLVRENEGVGARILADFEVDSVKVHDEVIRALSPVRRIPTPPPPSPMPVFTIKAQDILAQPVVMAYLRECETHGLFEQAREVTRALNEIRAWQNANREQVKAPDHKHVPVLGEVA